MTPAQIEFAGWCYVAAQGGKVPRPNIPVEEYEKSLARKATVAEFKESLRISKELNSKPEVTNENAMSLFADKAQKLGKNVINR
jgi:hypothetical protein